MWVNFTLTDSAMHEGGPHSEIAAASIRDSDARLGEVLAAVEQAGMFDDTAFVLVADHGMEENDPTVQGDWDVPLRSPASRSATRRTASSTSASRDRPRASAGASPSRSSRSASSRSPRAAATPRSPRPRTARSRSRARASKATVTVEGENGATITFNGQKVPSDFPGDVPLPAEARGCRARRAGRREREAVLPARRTRSASSLGARRRSARTRRGSTTPASPSIRPTPPAPTTIPSPHAGRRRRAGTCSRSRPERRRRPGR